MSLPYPKLDCNSLLLCCCHRKGVQLILVDDCRMQMTRLVAAPPSSLIALLGRNSAVFRIQFASICYSQPESIFLIVELPHLEWTGVFSCLLLLFLTSRCWLSWSPGWYAGDHASEQPGQGQCVLKWIPLVQPEDGRAAWVCLKRGDTGMPPIFVNVYHNLHHTPCKNGECEAILGGVIYIFRHTTDLFVSRSSSLCFKLFSDVPWITVILLCET